MVLIEIFENSIGKADQPETWQQSYSEWAILASK